MTADDYLYTFAVVQQGFEPATDVFLLTADTVDPMQFYKNLAQQCLPVIEIPVLYSIGSGEKLTCFVFHES